MSKKGTSHSAHLPRIRRIEGQVRGVIKMIEEERYCVDILTQIKAIKSALSSLEGKIIEEHLGHCVHQAFSNKNKKESDEMIVEIKELLRKTRN
ncbi:MAG: hypothetical protein CL678_12175 [Bdellovibrionaceae bacterium]|nr:hypothetical protein [Pseudobdellovibrionaceae bacterium]